MKNEICTVFFILLMPLTLMVTLYYRTIKKKKPAPESDKPTNNIFLNMLCTLNCFKYLNRLTLFVYDLNYCFFVSMKCERCLARK